MACCILIAGIIGLVLSAVFRVSGRRSDALAWRLRVER
jgi:hypothetical protein